MASSLADCGTAPSGGTLTFANDTCQLTFSAPGTYSFTTPKSVEGLAALLVGGGGGAAYTTGQNQDAGYAGSGGKVTYVDLSSNTVATPVSVTVGAGGTSSIGTPDDGQASSITVAATTSTANGGGKGIAINAPTYCTFPGNLMDYTGVGDGAGGNSTSRNGEPCVNAPGVNPSLGTADSAGAAASPLFAGLNQEFGAGGKLIALPASLPAKTVGAGANVAVDASGGVGADPVADVAGANGFAAFVWQIAPEVADTTLANTGSTLDGSVLAGVGSLLVGAAALKLSYRRRAK
jgi:hypothetical protein